MKHINIFVIIAIICLSITIKSALSLGIGVAPNTIHFDDSTKTNTIEIVNPNDFEISYNIKASPVFEIDSFGTVPAKDSKKVKIDLVNAVNRTELIIIETKSTQGIGVMPGVAVKAIVQTKEAEDTAKTATISSQKQNTGSVFLQEEKTAPQGSIFEKEKSPLVQKIIILLFGAGIAGGVVICFEIFTRNRKLKKRKKNGNKKFKYKRKNTN